MRLALVADRSADGGFYMLIKVDTWRPGCDDECACEMAEAGLLSGARGRTSRTAATSAAPSSGRCRWWPLPHAIVRTEMHFAVALHASPVPRVPVLRRRFRRVRRMTQATSLASAVISRSGWSYSCLADVPTSPARTARCASRCHPRSRATWIREHSAIQSRPPGSRSCAALPVPVQAASPC